MKRWMVLVWLTAGFSTPRTFLRNHPSAIGTASQTSRPHHGLSGRALPFRFIENIEEALQEGSWPILTTIGNTDPFHVTINPNPRCPFSKEGRAPLHQGLSSFFGQSHQSSCDTAPLRVSSPQAGPVYGGMTALSARRMQREALHELEDPLGNPERFIM